MKLTFIALMLFLSTHFHLFAQADYKTSVGVRAAPAGGITLKHFMTEKASFEGILTTRWHGINLTGLYELSQNAFHTERINFF